MQRFLLRAPPCRGGPPSLLRFSIGRSGCLGFPGSGLKCPCVLQPFAGSQPSPALQARDVFGFWLLRLPSCSPRLGPDFCDFPARVLNSPSFCSIFCCALLLLALAAHPGCYAFLLAGLDFGVFRARVLNSPAFCSNFLWAGNLRLRFRQASGRFLLWLLGLPSCSL